jgi:RNA polymerase sigma factor (sigma-70 family)
MWLFSRKNSANDEELVKNYFLTGNKTLVGDLFERHVKTVYGVCLFYFRDNEKSKDCVMQIFEKLLVDLRKTEVKNFKAWLGFVVRNYCISELRKNKGKYFLPETYLDFEVMDSNLEQEEQISRINDELMLEQLKDCLSKLKENQRICVEAFYLKGLSYQQISETTNLTTNEVKSFIQNGKRNLKLMIEEKIKQQKNVA